MAGLASEQRAMRWKRNGAINDIDRAVILTQHVYGWLPERAESYLYERILPSTRRMMRRPDIWAAIEIIATELERRLILSDDEANELLEGSGLKPVRPMYWGRRPC